MTTKTTKTTNRSGDGQLPADRRPTPFSRPGRSPPVDPDLDKGIAQCILQARVSGESIRSRLPELTGRQVVILQGAFKEGLEPPTPTKRGRRPDPELTRAFIDWKAGCRGQRLYRRFIKDHGKLRPSKRRREEATLMSGIYTRNRREKQAVHPHEADPPRQAPIPNRKSRFSGSPRPSVA